MADDERKCPNCDARPISVGFVAEARQAYRAFAGRFAQGGSAVIQDAKALCIMCGAVLPWTPNDLLGN
jgi:hypothetical protein